MYKEKDHAGVFLLLHGLFLSRLKTVTQSLVAQSLSEALQGALLF